MIDLQNITPIQYKDVNKILKFVFYVLDEMENETITPGYLFDILIMLETIIRDYNKVKEELLNISIEESLLEINNLRKEYQSKINFLQSIETDLLQKIDNKSKTIELQQMEISKFMREISLIVEESKNIKQQNSILNNVISELQDINAQIASNLSHQNINYQEIYNILQQKN